MNEFFSFRVRDWVVHRCKLLWVLYRNPEAEKTNKLKSSLVKVYLM